MITKPATHKDVRALAAAIRDGELTPGQLEHLVPLLHTLSTAAACSTHRTGTAVHRAARQLDLAGPEGVQRRRYGNQVHMSHRPGDRTH